MDQTTSWQTQPARSLHGLAVGPYLSLALIVSAWTIGAFGLSILLDDCGDARKRGGRHHQALRRRREFMKSHVV